MRKVQYGVAISLDGFIAGPNGEADWIKVDSKINFSEIWAQFDILMMGRRTFEVAVARLGQATFGGKDVFVLSGSLKPQDHPGVTIVSEPSRQWMQSLKGQAGRDIWLMGGGEVFRYMLGLGEVDSVSVMVIPVLLGAGVPLMSGPYDQTILKLSAHRVYQSGVVSLTYEINKSFKE